MSAQGLPIDPPPQLDCSRCSNRGYYPMIIAPETPDGESKQTVMFCTCNSGRQLRQISIEFRLSDLEELMRAVMPALEKARSLLHKPEEAGKEIDELIANLNLLLDRIRNAERRPK